MLALAACTGGVDLEREARGIPWDKVSGKIVYARWDETGHGPSRGRIFLIDVAARKVTLARDVAITSSPPSYDQVGWARDLAFRPDGSAIAFAVLNSATASWELRSLELSSGAEQVLFPDPQAHHNFPAWSPDGRVAYYSNGALGVHLYIDSDFVLSYPYMSRAAWLSTTSLVVSISDASTYGALYVIDPTTRSMTPIATSEAGPDREVFWSPAVSLDHRKLAYVRGGPAADGEEIWVSDVNGQNKVRLTHGFYDFDPAWSADGSAVLFGRWGIGLEYFELTSGVLTQVTSTRSNSMAWAP